MCLSSTAAAPSVKFYCDINDIQCGEFERTLQDIMMRSHDHPIESADDGIVTRLKFLNLSLKN